VRTWTNLIVESIETVNNALARGHYFFTDIKKEGILLHVNFRTFAKMVIWAVVAQGAFFPTLV
jgi:hypothetical protein